MSKADDFDGKDIRCEMTPAQTGGWNCVFRCYLVSPTADLGQITTTIRCHANVASCTGLISAVSALDKFAAFLLSGRGNDDTKIF